MPEARAKARKARAKAAPHGRSARARRSPPRAGGSTLAAAAVALYLVFQVYAPALNGPFVFDDTFLPYHTPDFPDDAARLDARASGRC